MPFKPVLCPLATKRPTADDGRDGLKIPLRKDYNGLLQLQSTSGLPGAGATEHYLYY